MEYNSKVGRYVQELRENTEGLSFEKYRSKRGLWFDLILGVTLVAALFYYSFFHSEEYTIDSTLNKFIRAYLQLDQEKLALEEINYQENLKKDKIFLGKRKLGIHKSNPAPVKCDECDKLYLTFKERVKKTGLEILNTLSKIEREKAVSKPYWNFIHQQGKNALSPKMQKDCPPAAAFYVNNAMEEYILGLCLGIMRGKFKTRELKILAGFAESNEVAKSGVKNSPAKLLKKRCLKKGMPIFVKYWNRVSKVGKRAFKNLPETEREEIFKKGEREFIFTRGLEKIASQEKIAFNLPANDLIDDSQQQELGKKLYLQQFKSGAANTNKHSGSRNNPAEKYLLAGKKEFQIQHAALKEKYEISWSKVKTPGNKDRNDLQLFGQNKKLARIIIIPKGEKGQKENRIAASFPVRMTLKQGKWIISDNKFSLQALEQQIKRKIPPKTKTSTTEKTVSQIFFLLVNYLPFSTGTIAGMMLLTILLVALFIYLMIHYTRSKWEGESGDDERLLSGETEKCSIVGDHIFLKIKLIVTNVRFIFIKINGLLFKSAVDHIALDKISQISFREMFRPGCFAVGIILLPLLTPLGFLFLVYSLANRLAKIILQSDAGLRLAVIFPCSSTEKIRTFINQFRYQLFSQSEKDKTENQNTEDAVFSGSLQRGSMALRKSDFIFLALVILVASLDHIQGEIQLQGYLFFPLYLALAVTAGVVGGGWHGIKLAFLVAAAISTVYIPLPILDPFGGKINVENLVPFVLILVTISVLCVVTFNHLWLTPFSVFLWLAIQAIYAPEGLHSPLLYLQLSIAFLFSTLFILFNEKYEIRRWLDDINKTIINKAKIVTTT